MHRLHLALSLCLRGARKLCIGARSAHRIRVRRFLELVQALDKVPLSVRIRPDSCNPRLARNHVLLRVQRIEADLNLRRTCRDIVAVIPGLSNHDRGLARSVINADRLGLRIRGNRTLIAEVVGLSRVDTRKICGILLHKIARAVRKTVDFRRVVTVKVHGRIARIRAVQAVLRANRIRECRKANLLLFAVSLQRISIRRTRKEYLHARISLYRNAASRRKVTKRQLCIAGRKRTERKTERRERCGHRAGSKTARKLSEHSLFHMRLPSFRPAPYSAGKGKLQLTPLS